MKTAKITKLKKHISRLFIGSLAVVTLLPILPINALPTAPSGLTVSGGNKPTVSWDAVPSSGIDASNWVERTPGAQWSSRFTHASVVFNDKLWVLGGRGNGTYYNDVWYSEDGNSWTLATSEAGWVARSDLGAAVFDGKIWIMGGLGSNDGIDVWYNDVWYSEDGINWTLATDAPGWSPRSGSQGFVISYDNRLWVIGGASGSGEVAETRYDAWYSENGIDWVQATTNVNWGNVLGRTLAVFNGRIMAFGGINYDSFEILNDIWSSTDGVNWQQERESSDWGARLGISVIKADENNLLLIGGVNMIDRIFYNDVWHSSNGLDWQLVTDSFGWGTSFGNTVANFRNKLWIIGGSDGSYGNTNAVYSTADTSIAGYKLCWDKVEAGCSNSVELDSNGQPATLPQPPTSQEDPVIFYNPLDQFITNTYAATNQISYTFTEPLDPGKWYFSVYSIDGDGNQSVLAATTSAEITPGLPNTGIFKILPLFALIALFAGMVTVINKQPRKASR